MEHEDFSITVERGYDFTEILEVMSSMWDDIRADEDHELEEEADKLELSYWYRLTIDEELAGYYEVQEFGPDTLMFHAYILKEHRQKCTQEATNLLLETLREDFPDAWAMYACIPDHMGNVIKAAAEFGLRPVAEGPPMQDMPSTVYGRLIHG